MANISESQAATVSCPGSETMTNILLPMFGNAWRGASLCNHTASWTWVKAACQGQNACTLNPSNTSLGGADPVRPLEGLPGGLLPVTSHACCLLDPGFVVALQRCRADATLTRPHPRPMLATWQCAATPKYLSFYFTCSGASPSPAAALALALPARTGATATSTVRLPAPPSMRTPPKALPVPPLRRPPPRRPPPRRSPPTPKAPAKAATLVVAKAPPRAAKQPPPAKAATLTAGKPPRAAKQPPARGPPSPRLPLPDVLPKPTLVQQQAVPAPAQPAAAPAAPRWPPPQPQRPPPSPQPQRPPTSPQPQQSPPRAVLVSGGGAVNPLMAALPVQLQEQVPGLGRRLQQLGSAPANVTAAAPNSMSLLAPAGSAVPNSTSLLGALPLAAAPPPPPMGPGSLDLDQVEGSSVYVVTTTGTEVNITAAGEWQMGSGGVLEECLRRRWSRRRVRPGCRWFPLPPALNSRTPPSMSPLACSLRAAARRAGQAAERHRERDPEDHDHPVRQPAGQWAAGVPTWGMGGAGRCTGCRAGQQQHRCSEHSLACLPRPHHPQSLWNTLFWVAVALACLLAVHILARVVVMWRRWRMPQLLEWPRPELLLLWVTLPIIAGQGASECRETPLASLLSACGRADCTAAPMCFFARCTRACSHESLPPRPPAAEFARSSDPAERAAGIMFGILIPAALLAFAFYLVLRHLALVVRWILSL